MRRTTAPLVFAAASFVVAGGLVHLREWLDGYRAVPEDVAGSAVVRVGFPVNAGLSFLVAIALIATVFVVRRAAPATVAVALGLQIGSLTTLIVSRTGSVFGWSEPVWNRGANQARAVEIGALVSLAFVVWLHALYRPQGQPIRSNSRPGGP